MSLGGNRSLLSSESSVYLRKRHEETPKFPQLWESPFRPYNNEQKDSEGKEEELSSGYDFDGFRTYPTRKPWSDLLLDISMTTAFNSLTNGTEALDPETSISYLLFFTLVWWIWAAQVCYDVRFTKADWMHRLSVFLQFIVFCALAAFTKDFDIGYQISSSASAETQFVKEIQELGGFSEEEISAAQFREDRLPILNARGISVVMMLSRVLLLFQYLLTVYHAPAMNDHDSPLSRIWTALTGPSFRAFQTHLFSLTLSAISFFIAFLVLDSSAGQDRGAQIAKIILWYLPVLMEIGAHFLALAQRGHVRYPVKGIYDRSSAAFIIILGGGLDKITEGFQLIVGNVTIGRSGAGLIFAGAITFITQFSLYFEMTKGHTITKEFAFCRRVLAWFIAHFLYFSSLIIMLQAIAALLKFGNIGKALNLPLQFLAEANGAILYAGDGQFISSDEFDINGQVQALGLDLNDLVSIVNDGVSLGLESNSSVLDLEDRGAAFNTPALQVAHNAALQGSAILISVILDNFELTPDSNSVLGSALELIVNADANNTNFSFDDVWYGIAEGAFTSEAIPALWFFGSAGLTLLSLSALGVIKWWNDLDSYRLSVLSIRLAVGITTCLLSLVDLHQGNAFLNTVNNNDTTFTFKLDGAAVWTLASHSLLIPIFAIVIACEQLAEFIIIFVLQQRAKSASNEPTKHVITSIANIASLGVVARPETYDPYKEHVQSIVSINVIERGHVV